MITEKQSVQSSLTQLAVLVIDTAGKLIQRHFGDDAQQFIGTCWPVPVVELFFPNVVADATGRQGLVDLVANVVMPAILRLAELKSSCATTGRKRAAR